jgi:hypothetical protein
MASRACPVTAASGGEMSGLTVEVPPVARRNSLEATVTAAGTTEQPPACKARDPGAAVDRASRVTAGSGADRTS